MIVVGMDVHVRNSFLCVTDTDGRLLKRGRVENTLDQIAQFLGDLEAQDSSMRVVMENTTNSRAMHRLMMGYGKQAGLDLRAEVLNPRKFRVIAESVTKCDQTDAAVINEVARSNFKLPLCYVPDDEVFALREHLRSRADLVRVRTMLKNRVHAVLHRRGILNPLKDLFSKPGRQWLAELKLDEAGRSIVDRYLTILDELEQVIAQSTASLNQLGRSQRWCKPVALLRTMPGIGIITSLTILAELGDINRFKSRAAVSNYSGMVPVMRNSNDKHYHGGITHRGPAALRSTLVEAAWISQARVPQYAALLSRVASRKGKQVAIVAVARRMLEDAWTMLKRDEVFRLMSADLDMRTGEVLAGPSDAG